MVSRRCGDVAQSRPTLSDPMDCSPPGSSVHGIFQATVLEWVAISFSRGSSQRRDRTQVSRITGRRFPVSATRKPDLGNGGKGRGVCRQSWIPPLSVSGQARPQTWLGGGLGSRLPTSVSSTDSSELLAPTRHCASPRVSMKMSERLSMEALCHPKWVSA